MADITSTTKITITEVEIFNTDGEEVAVKKDSAISEDPSAYSPKAHPDTRGRMKIYAELEKTDGTTFKDGDEITIQTETYNAVGTINNVRLSPNDWTDLSGTTGVIGQWKVNGATGSNRKTIKIKLNSRANGQAVLDNVTMDLGSKGVNFYGVAYDVVAKVKIGSSTFAFGMLERTKGYFNDTVWQSASSNNYATIGYRVGTDLYESLVNTRGASGTKKKILLECSFDDATAQDYISSGFDVGIPRSLTEASECFPAGAYMPSLTPASSAWTQITPNSGESYSAFKTRVMSTPMQYGFYNTSTGAQVVYYFGEMGTNTPDWSNFTTDNVPEKMADIMISDGWYFEADRTALTALLKSAFETSSIVGKRIPTIRLYTALDYETVLEDTEKPLICTITYDPGTSSETVTTFNKTVLLTGAFGSVVVKPFSCTVMKYDDDTKTPLAGAKIKLQRSNNGSWVDYTQEVTSDSSGLINFENLGLGTYRVVETEAPEGYSLAHSPGYDSESGTVISETFVIASTDTEGAKIQMGNVQNIQEAMVVYKDITNGVTLKTDTFSGIGGEPMTYDTAPSIATYESQGYEVLSNNYVKGTLFDDDSSVTQVFTVVLKKVDDMINVDCSACEELREISPDFVSKGVTQTICTSLKNDTGLNPTLTTLHDDCEDLDTANDCLIGMMDGEIEKYEACDWQKFMHKFIPNLYHLLKAGICALCGLWTNVHNLWSHVNDLEEKQVDICDLIQSTIAPPMRAYGVHPLKTSGTDVGHATSHVEFHPDDGTLNPYTKSSQGVGIDYGRLETTDCKTGECTVYEWIQPKIFYTYIKEGTQTGDVLWYATKQEIQSACGFTDRLWRTFTESSWTWTDSEIYNGDSAGKYVGLRITCDPGGMGANYIGVEFRGTTYPVERTASYDFYPSPLGNVPRLYTHRCGAV